MNTLYGMKIVESNMIEEVPKLQLSSKFTACSDEFRAKTNEWLRQTFGTYLPVYFVGNDTIIAHPKHVAALRKQLAKQGGRYV